jgi:ABC-type branched-subunit amino acid transport system substrate-binding protein/ABC-type taurine transport system substrate-binding protein
VSIYDDEEGRGEVTFYPFETEPIPCAPTSEEPPAFTTTDAVIALQIAAGSRAFDSRWDVSGDGQATSLDALIILQSATGKAAEKTHLRIGYQPSTHQLAEMVAIEKGWWEEDLADFGITEVTDHQFPSGLPEMQSMMAGDLDVAYVGVTPPITAIAQGLDAKIVAAVQTQGSDLVLRPEINYTSPSNLFGLKIATFPPGSVMDIVLKKFLTDNNVSNVTIVSMGPEDAIEAIENGSVNGTFLPHPCPAMIELDGNGSSVVRSGAMWADHACCCLLVSGELIRDHPDLVREVVRTHIKATEYVNENQNESAEIFAEKIGYDLNTVNYSFEHWDGEWISDPHLELECIIEFANISYDLGYVNRSLTVEDLFDTSFYDSIDRQIKIGTLLPLTGDLAAYGGPMQDAARLAITQVNENGGVLESNITLVSKDSETSESATIDAMNSLVTADRVPAVIGAAASDVSLAIIDIAVKNQIVQISPSNTAPIFTTYADDDFYWRTAPSDALQGKATAKLANESGYVTASTLALNNSYGVGFEEVVKDEFEKLGGTVINRVKYDPNVATFDSEVDEASASDPDVIVLIGYPDAGSTILNISYWKGVMNESDWLLSEGMCTDELAEMVGNDTEGNYIVAGFVGVTPDPRAVGPAYDDFTAAYEAEYGRNPAVFCSNTYDAAMIIALAIEKAGSAGGIAIRDAIPDVANPPGVEVSDIGTALAKIRNRTEINYQGASGNITFNDGADIPQVVIHFP